MLDAKQAKKKRPLKGNGRKNYRKRPARMPPHHGCFMPNKRKKGKPKGNGRKNLEKSLQECPHIMADQCQMSKNKEHPKAMEERT